jgi:P-type E1-E2 ATPase
LPVTEIKELAGHSISASLNGIEYTVGQPRGENPSWLTFKNQLMVALYKQDTLIALMGLNDPIRSESSEMVAQLRKVGVKEIALVTGDRDETAQEVALAVGISSVYSEEKPEGKLAITQRYKDMCNGSVVVVGDGTNDAPALALADVGVAMGAHGASAASEAADIVIVEDSIDRLTHAIFFARLARKKAMQAAATGMFLSICAMGLGAFGITSPSFNALAQELIDVVAIAWALTTLLHKPA